MDFVDVEQEKGCGFYSSMAVTGLLCLQIHKSRRPCARKKLSFRLFGKVSCGDYVYQIINITFKSDRVGVEMRHL